MKRAGVVLATGLALVAAWTAAGATGPPKGYVSWADARHGWAPNHGDWPCTNAHPSQGGFVCATEDGGRTWRAIFNGGNYVFAAVRTSVDAGIVSTGAHGHVQYWTRDNGRHWYPTEVAGGRSGLGDPSPAFVGKGRRLYWAAWSASTVYQVEPWPPAEAAVCAGAWAWGLATADVAPDGNICLGPPVEAGMRSVAVAELPGRVLTLSPVPVGFAAVFHRNADGAFSVVVRNRDANTLRDLPLPSGLPGGHLALRRVSIAWPALTLRALWLSRLDDRSWEVVYGSADGGETWTTSVTPAWNKGPEVPVPLAAAAGAAVDGEIVLVGGRWVPRAGPAQRRPASDRVEAFSPGEGTWRPLPSLPVAVTYAAAASVDERLYVVGGFDAAGKPRRTAFVLHGGRWRALPRPLAPRAAAGAAIVGSRLYVAGGVGKSGLARGMLVFDLRRARWSLARGPCHARISALRQSEAGCTPSADGPTASRRAAGSPSRTGRANPNGAASRPCLRRGARRLPSASEGCSYRSAEWTTSIFGQWSGSTHSTSWRVPGGGSPTSARRATASRWPPSADASTRSQAETGTGRRTWARSTSSCPLADAALIECAVRIPPGLLLLSLPAVVLVAVCLSARPAIATIVPGRGMADVRLWMTEPQVRDRLGAPLGITRRRGSLGFLVTRLHYRQVDVDLQRLGGRRVVVRVSTMRPGEKTESGVGVGSRLAAVLPLRGVHCWREGIAHYCMIGSRARPLSRFTMFWISASGRVTLISVSLVVNS